MSDISLPLASSKAMQMGLMKARTNSQEWSKLTSTEDAKGEELKVHSRETRDRKWWSWAVQRAERVSSGKMKKYAGNHTHKSCSTTESLPSLAGHGSECM